VLLLLPLLRICALLPRLLLLLLRRLPSGLLLCFQALELSLLGSHNLTARAAVHTQQTLRVWQP
jgi:hypothetical protein